MEGLGQQTHLRWVGWLGGEVRDQQRPQVEDYCREHDLSPVELSAEVAAGFYEGFSNSSLWPVLHYLPDRMRYECDWWGHYQRANELFAEKVLEVAGDDDVVWVHDYHLMLLPAMLRKRRPKLKVGFFLHTPFPSYEVFRCHPNRRELIAGLLGADQVGFHTFGYMRHFRSTVLRLLGLDSEMHRIRSGGRNTWIGVYPIGINASKFVEEIHSDGFAAQRDKLASAYEGKKIVLSVERLDYTKGIDRRLEAIDLFLERRARCDDIVFIFVSVPSREDVPEYQALSERVATQVGAINGRHATVDNTPIHFLRQSVEFSELCALYDLADVALVTPTRDGMNLVAKEYVACKEQGGGVLVLSEFAGAMEEMYGAVVVNPYDVGGVAQAVGDALEMPPDEQRRRLDEMRRRVLSFDNRAWAREFMDNLVDRQPAAPEIITDAGTVQRQVAQRFAKSRRIACFLDYDGTLRDFVPDPDQAMPDAAARELLDRLCNTAGLDVFILSGRKASDLEAWMGHYPATLIGEHGYAFRRAGGSDWQPLKENIDLSWKNRILDVCRLFERTTPGSSVEEKRTSVVWHYRRADPEFGTFKAQKLMGELYEMVANMPVEIHHGKKIVEISSMSVSKGAALMRFLQEGDYDLAFCAGDDLTDETMFRIKDSRLLSVKVGAGDSQALYQVPGPADFIALMHGVLDAMGRMEPNPHKTVEGSTRSPINGQ
jgi:trehalose 6-phosphate synthase/phosphatase